MQTTGAKMSNAVRQMKIANDFGAVADRQRHSTWAWHSFHNFKFCVFLSERSLLATQFKKVNSDKTHTQINNNKKWTELTIQTYKVISNADKNKQTHPQNVQPHSSELFYSMQIVKTFSSPNQTQVRTYIRLFRWLSVIRLSITKWK